ncbi:uncharacterized protein LOC106085412 [Stomoxys calcitrans]|uniref:Uncharacterized protein n=1 Tax=Stomoxys calcitrans TaxID=35570 RepID=A0A1I8QAA2_STOCA|nr:uncharacterized protein LOC106085412 [Stomoxys calcitrans]
MRTSTVSRYALRLTFGQSSTPASGNTLTTTGNPDRVITRSATCLAVIGIALSSFSLKQMLSTSANKSSIPMRKFSF